MSDVAERNWQLVPGSVSPVRVWQIAKSLGIESKEVLAVARNRGVQVKSASSNIEPICAQVIRDICAGAME